MKKSIRKIERRTRGRDTTSELLARGFDLDGTVGDEWKRWRSLAANETYAWRAAA